MNVGLGRPPFKQMLTYCVLQKHLNRLKYLHSFHHTLAVGLSESSFINRPMCFHRYMIRNDFWPPNKLVSQIRYLAKKAIVKESKGKGKAKMLLTDDEMLDVMRVDVMRSQMQQVINRLKDAFVQQLSVRSTGSIENLQVVIEEEEYPLHEIAKIHKKNPNLVVVNMTDFPEALKPTLEAVRSSQMNLNPQQDGTMIYIPLPKVTREHREALAKGAKSMLNKAKDEIRDIQNRFQKDAKNKKDHFSEDLIFTVHSQIKAIADQYTDEGDKMLQLKEKELLAEL